MTTAKTNPSTLDLLRMGAKIQFIGDYWMRGDPENRDINVGTQFASEGSWSLSEDGLREALANLAEMAANDGYTLDGNPLPEKE